MQEYQFSVDVRVRALPAQSTPGAWAFAYTITVTNTGRAAAQLIARHWLIRDAHGRLEEVKGLGVVGQQPLLQPGAGFRYTSGCLLATETGSMEGSYFCVAEDGTRFEAPIARFALDAAAAGDDGAADDDEHDDDGDGHAPRAGTLTPGGPRVLH